MRHVHDYLADPARTLGSDALVSIVLLTLTVGWPAAPAVAQSSEPRVRIETEESAYLARMYLSGRAVGACLYGTSTQQGSLEIDAVAALGRRDHPGICYGPRVLGAVLFASARTLPYFDLARGARRALIFRPDWKLFAIVDNVRPWRAIDPMTDAEAGEHQGVEGVWMLRRDFALASLVLLADAGD